MINSIEDDNLRYMQPVKRRNPWPTVFYILAANLFITCTVDRFMHPQLTETQLFLRIPKVFIYNFSL